MHFKSGLLVLSAVMLLLVTQECNSQLMCYVCEHCTTVTTKTPLLACDESFFNGGGTELPSTMTTTEMTTSSTEEDPTTTMSTTESTTMASSTSTSTETTEDPTTVASTEPQPPTPPTAGPVETTTALPTPPTQGTIIPVVEIVTQGTIEQNETVANATTARNNMSSTTNYMSSTTFRVRQQRRSVENMPADSVSYHCYSVRFTANKTVSTQRGCSRVTTEESVCNKLETSVSNDTTVSKCQFCQTNRCNGSSTLGVSIVAVIVGLVASLFKRS